MLKRLFSSMFTPLRGFRLGLITSLFIIVLSFPGFSIAYAQIPSLEHLQNDRADYQASVDYIDLGNVHIAEIWLDGLPLFEIAAAAAVVNEESDRNLLPYTVVI